MNYFGKKYWFKFFAGVLRFEQRPDNFGGCYANTVTPYPCIYGKLFNVTRTGPDLNRRTSHLTVFQTIVVNLINLAASFPIVYNLFSTKGEV